MGTLVNGAMPISINDPYVYLTSLSSHKYKHYQHIGAAASAALNTDLSSTSETVQRGLTFLQAVAVQQQAHEMSFIKHRLKMLESLTDGGSELKETIEQLKNILNSGDNIDYIQLINGINLAIQGLEKYKTRIRAMNDKEKHINVDGERNIVNSIGTTIGNFVDRRQKFNYSQEELIRQLTFRFFTAGAGKEFLAQQMSLGNDGVLHFAAAVGALSAELSRYVWDTGLLKHSYKLYKDEAEFKSELARLEKELNARNFDKQGLALVNNDSFLAQAEKMFGLKIDNLEAQNSNKNSNYEENSSRKEKKEALEKLHSLTKNNDSLQLSESFKKKLMHVAVTWKGTNKISIFNELYSLLVDGLSGVHMGSLNSGTDMILGQLAINVSADLEQEDPIQKTLLNIKNDLEKDNKAAVNNARKTSQIYIDRIQELENALEGLGKGFILHETNKFYQSVENGRWFRDKAGFHGRNMNLFNFIDSMAEFGSGLGVNVNWLRFLAYNLGDQALGSKNVGPLEKYFAIAAGLIMFDDFAIMGREVIQGDLQFSNVENIHLYKLQDTYVPASFFLQATYSAMSQIEDALLSGNAIKTKITPPALSYTRDPSVSFASQWEDVKKQAEKVSIKMSFAANFLALIGELLG